MKVMIISDSHAMKKRDVLTIIHAHTADYYIHCGDLFLPYEDLAIPNLYIVKGNNDFGDIPTELQISIDNIPFFITHGHHYHVDSGIEELASRASSLQAKVVCFGHTHAPLVQQEESILFINPGSLSYPRGRYHNPTYCLLDTTTMLVTFYDSKNHTICRPFDSLSKKSFSWKTFFRYK